MTIVHRKSKPWIVVIAATLVMLMGASMISGASVLHIALLEYYERSPVVTTWLGSLFTSMFCFASIMASGIINSFNTRTCIIVGGILNLIGFSCSSIVTDFELLFLTYGLLGGGAWSLLSPITVEIVGVYNLATAFGIEMIAAGIGFFIGPVIGGLLLGTDGTFTVVFIFAACMTFLASILGMLMTIFMPPQKPNPKGKVDDSIEQIVDEIMQVKTCEEDESTHEKFEKDETVSFL